MAQWNGAQQRKKEDFSKRKLVGIPQELFSRASQVESLDLQVNQLKHVSLISKLTNLKELFLSWNELSEFPREVGELSSLEVLYLNQNRMGNVPTGVFSRLQNLRRLNLSTNQLSELPTDLGKCRKLAYLNISSNRLSNLQVLVGLQGLRELCVDHNRLVELPAELFLGTVLTTFKAVGNPLRKPPEEVCVGGVKDIQSYFSQLGAGLREERARRVKAMFLGSSMAGKSTLCRSLKEGQAVGVAVEDRTVGIDISEVERDGVQLLFWDFAGHEEYYLTHHVFITPQALVILTINLASYSIADPTSFKDMVSFWMNNVMMRVPDSVVLPVGTHADQCTESEIQEKEKDIGKNIREMLEERQSKLQSRISNIKDKDDPTPFSEQLHRLYHLADLNIKVLDLLPLDCTKSEEIMKLQEHILKHVQNKELFPNVESTLPRSYQVVESSIRNLMKNKDFPKHGIVGIDDLRKRCSDLEELAREDWQCILRYLHRIGIVMWYEEIEGVRDKVFTKPSFLITLFKTVVRHDLVKCLEDLPQNILQKVNGLGRYRKMWANELKGKSTLRNTAIAALVRRSLMQLDLAREDSFVKEIAGSRQREGELVCLLRHFDICLPIKLSSPLNPQAQEFDPRMRWSPSSAQTLYDPDGGYLFPGYLKDTVTVMKMWGVDRDDDLRVNVYFLPEIPYGVFHRLIIRACLLYSKYWLGKDCFLLGYDTTLVLLRQNSDKNQDEYIQIRCRCPTSNADFRRSWDLIVTMIRKLNQLTEQWPGLFQIVCSPCWESGCEEGFEWRDLGKLGGCDIYDAVKEEKLVCSNGHICRSEFLFPKVPSAPKPDTENEATFLNIQAQNVTVSVNQAGSP